MSNVLDLGLWLASSALIAAAGVFLDKYHISKSTKSRLQDYLVHLFFGIEEKKVPDISETVTYPFLILTSRLGLVGSIFFFIPFSYFAMVSTAYFGRQALGKEVEEGYVHY